MGPRCVMNACSLSSMNAPGLVLGDERGLARNEQGDWPLAQQEQARNGKKLGCGFAVRRLLGWRGTHANGVTPNCCSVSLCSLPFVSWTPPGRPRATLGEYRRREITTKQRGGQDVVKGASEACRVVRTGV